MRQEDHHISVFMGTTYDIERERPETIGELKNLLRYIIEDLPDDNLEISEVSLRNGKLDYILKEGL